jgi:hypothetical protein
MRAAAAIVMLLGAAGAASAQSPLAAEVRALADRYHERPARIDTLRPLVTQAAQADPHVDGRFTGLRVGLARTLIKRGRIPEARRELQAVLDEKTPSNPADWTLKDAPEARRLLDALPGRP